MVNLNLNLYKKTIKRGAIYWVVNIANPKKKLYPCLVVSNDVQNNIGQLPIVLPITTYDIPQVPFHIQILLAGKPAKIIAEKIHTLDLSKLRLEDYQGQIEQETMLEVEKAISLVLQLKF